MIQAKRAKNGYKIADCHAIGRDRKKFLTHEEVESEILKMLEYSKTLSIRSIMVELESAGHLVHEKKIREVVMKMDKEGSIKSKSKFSQKIYFKAN